MMHRTGEESVRRMTPVAAPEEQRESVAALMELIQHAVPQQPELAAYRLVSPSGEVTEAPGVAVPPARADHRSARAG